MTTMSGDSAATQSTEPLRVLVICGAGASSTFVSLWMRAAAAARGHRVIVTASSTSALADDAVGADVVLVGPHLADQYDAIATDLARSRVVAALLPESVIRGRSGDEALDIALAAAPER
jgi:PTS system cellobiose-specific IIB component